MEEKIRSHQVNRLSAILFAILPLISLLSYIGLQLAYPGTFPMNFSFYLWLLRSAAYILMAIVLVRAKKDRLFLFAFTLPVIISLIALILHYQKILALLDLLTYGSLYFVVLGAYGYLPGCKKAARYLCLIPSMVGLIRQICSLSFTLTGIIFSITLMLALLVTGILALEQTRVETAEPPMPLTKLVGMGLITFGTLFLISRAVDVVLHYFEMVRIVYIMSSIVPFTCEMYFGASAIELLLCVIVSICAIYGGILLCYKKTTETE